MYTSWILRAAGRAVVKSHGIRALGSLSKPQLLRHVLPTSDGIPLSSRTLSTQVGAQLSEFLKTEIAEEQKMVRKEPAPPTTITGFTIKCDQAEIVLTKNFENEVITVSFNVNHTVDSEYKPVKADDAPPPEDEPVPMVSKPEFRVEIVKGNQKFVLDCSFTDTDNEEYEDAEAQPPQSEPFYISDMSVYSGDSADKVYVVSAHVIDGQLYDHLMSYLAERGIDESFAENVIKYATGYEHSQYVSLLERIQKFASA